MGGFEYFVLEVKLWNYRARKQLRADLLLLIPLKGNLKSEGLSDWPKDTQLVALFLTSILCIPVPELSF